MPAVIRFAWVCAFVIAGLISGALLTEPPTTDETSPEASPSVEGDATPVDAEGATTPVEEPAPDDEVEPADAAPPEEADPVESDEDPELVRWRSMLGRPCAVTTAGGGVVGKLKRVDAQGLTIVDHAGHDVVLQRSDVTKIESLDQQRLGLPATPTYPRDHGVHMVAWGSVIIFGGGALMLGSIPFMASGSPGFGALAFMLPGGLVVGGGVALVVYGVRRKKQQERALPFVAKRHALAIGPTRTRDSWGGGLRFRF